MPLNDLQRELCSTSTWDFSDLRVRFVSGRRGAAFPMVEET
jgi:hypothetical protein